MPTRESPKDTVDRIVAMIDRVDSMWRLNGINLAWEERMKALAAKVLKPGSDEPIEDLDALDYIWDITGDRSWSSQQEEPFRPRALDYYVGRKVVHVWGTGTLVKVGGPRAKPERYGIRVRLRCRCGKSRRTVYAQPGCHTGAFCYVYDRKGNYLADLRNQEFHCKNCRTA